MIWRNRCSSPSSAAVTSAPCGICISSCRTVSSLPPGIAPDGVNEGGGPGDDHEPAKRLKHGYQAYGPGGRYLRVAESREIHAGIVDVIRPGAGKRPAQRARG